ncbi:MAG: 3-hydroxyacyl-CoA dehydrogenase NAD-binding domain-containing protein [Geminicoccaceae bacterium]
MITGPIDREPVAIIGSGLIGAGWAAVFTAAGLEVRAWDYPARLAGLRAPAAAAGDAQEAAAGPPRAAGAGEVARGCGGRCSPRAENAPEDIAVKRALFARIEVAADPATVIASSTSALLWSDLALG